MSAAVHQFGGKFVTDSEGTFSGHASSIAAQWDTAVDFWWDPTLPEASGKGGIVFFGLIQGDILFQDLEFSALEAGSATTLLTSDGYDSAVSVTLLYHGVTIADIFDSCCYSTGIEQKAPKRIGDRIIIEGGTRYRIIKES